MQQVNRSAEHKGATQNTPRHGLGLEAKGIETRRRATKGKANARSEYEERKESPMEKRVSFHRKGKAGEETILRQPRFTLGSRGPK